MSIPAANAVNTSTLVGLREDLSDVILVADTDETPFHSWAADASVVANARKHEWEDQGYAAKRDDAEQSEGADFAIGARTAPKRYQNICEIMHKTPGVTGTSEVVTSAGREGTLNRETLLQGIELRRDVNFTTLSNKVRSNGSARTMSAIQSWAKHYSGAGDGTAPANNGDGSAAPVEGTLRELDQNIVEGLLQQFSDNGGRPGILFMGGTQKRKFNALFKSSGVNSVENRMQVNPTGANSAGGGGRITAGAKIVLSVATLETDWGTQIVIYDQDVSDNQILVFDVRDRYQPNICTLPGRNFRVKPLPETGDWMGRDLRWEGTLQVPSPNSVGIIGDLSTTFG